MIYEVVGAIGLLLILVAYFLLQKRKLTDDDHLYNILNMVGSVCIAVYSSYYEAWLSVALNAIWFVIALFDMFKNIRNKEA